MRTREYIFALRADGKSRTAHPVYGNGLSKTWEMDRKRHFYREGLDGDLTFIGADYDFIMDSPFDSYVYVDIYRKGKPGKYFSGRFIRTDCEIDEDKHRLTVSLEVNDQYNELMENMGDEYDLLKQPLEVQPLSLVRRPILQVYVRGDTVVSSFIGGSWWETESKSVTLDYDLRIKYGFKLAEDDRLIGVQCTAGGGAPSAITGVYTGDMVYQSNPGGHTNRYVATLKSDDTDYTIILTLIQVVSTSPDPVFELDISVENSAGTLLYFRDGWHQQTYTYPYEIYNQSFTCTAQGSSSGSVTVAIQGFDMLTRYLCGVDSINGEATSPVPSDDICQNVQGYTRIGDYPYAVGIMSSRKSATPTEWGMDDDGNYYLPPDDEEAYYPISRSMWDTFSFWMKFSGDDTSYETAARATFTLKHAYPLHTCIQALLKLCAPEVTFEPTADYSQFLYGDGNGINSPSMQLFVTPKSNLLLGEYDRPAEKAMTTLENFLDMLKNCFRAVWFVDGSNRLRIEHVSWFMRGQSESKPGIGADLTSMICPSNGKPWSFGLNRYRYSRERMPQRYEFAWMDDVSQAFEGEPIEIRSNFVEKGQIENIQIGQFTSDVDYMLYASEEVSKDGFALLCAYQNPGSASDDIPSVVFIEKTVGKYTYNMQNGYLSFTYLIPKFWIYDLPSKNVTINGQDLTLSQTSREKEQDVTFPCPEDPDVYSLVRTGIGDGQIQKASINMQSRMAEMTLIYDTEPKQ